MIRSGRPADSDQPAVDHANGQRYKGSRMSLFRPLTFCTVPHWRHSQLCDFAELCCTALVRRRAARPGRISMSGLSHTSLILLLCVACVGAGCLLGLLSWCVQRISKKMRQEREREGHRALSEERRRRRQRQQQRAQRQGTVQLPSVRPTRKIDIPPSAPSAPAGGITSSSTALQTSAETNFAGQKTELLAPPSTPPAAFTDALALPQQSRRAVRHVNPAEQQQLGMETRPAPMSATTATAAAISALAADRHPLQLTADDGDDAPPDSEVKHHVVDVRSEAAPSAAAMKRYAFSGPAQLSAASAADTDTAAEEEGHEERATTADVDTPTLLRQLTRWPYYLAGEHAIS